MFQTSVDGRKEREGGWGAGFGVHAQRVRCNISTSAYLQHLAVNWILSSLGICIWRWAGGGGWCSNKEKPSGLVLAKHSLCRPFTFMYVSTYQTISNQILIQPPPSPSSSSPFPPLLIPPPVRNCSVIFYFYFIFILFLFFFFGKQKTPFPPLPSPNNTYSCTYILGSKEGREEKRKKSLFLEINKQNNFILITCMNIYIFSYPFQYVCM